MTVAALSCVATLATGAGAARPLSIAPIERPTRREQSEARSPRSLQIPQPQNGAIEGVSLATLNTIAACESGGDPTAVNAAGYYGKYQFDLQTWAAVGGSGNPAKASEAEQDYRAALLYCAVRLQPLARLRRLAT